MIAYNSARCEDSNKITWMKKRRENRGRQQETAPKRAGSRCSSSMELFLMITAMAEGRMEGDIEERALKENIVQPIKNSSVAATEKAQE